MGECWACKHWKQKHGNAGECCIRAPWVFLDPEYKVPLTWFPQTLGNQSCGEHETKYTNTNTNTEGGE